MSGDGVVDAEIVDDGFVPTIQGYRSTWAVRHTETLDPTDPWTGWLDVHSDSTTRLIELGGCDLEPDEARALARVLNLAADHAEQYPLLVSRLISDLRCGPLSDRMGDQPDQAKRAAHDAVQQHGDEAWRTHAHAVETQRLRQETRQAAERAAREGAT